MAELLDSDTPDTVRMPVADAVELAISALKRVGYTGEEATIISDQLIDNALCGYKFAGLPRLFLIAHNDKTEAGRVPVKTVHETNLSATLDGGNNIGYLGVWHAARVAIEKAKKSGMASVGVYNTQFSGRNSYYVEKIVKEGFVALHIGSSDPRVMPPGAAAPALGTNPICFGFPSKAGPVTVDIGTASIMTGDIRLHSLLKKPLPEGIAFDRHGEPTQDADAALGGGVLPFGGHKGYGLSFAMQALGLLAGSARVRGQVQDFGFLF
jgi:LDH2 family malate/lactate/ureidoglycolate dehydrogenase